MDEKQWIEKAQQLVSECEDERVSVNRTPHDPEEWKRYYEARDKLTAHFVAHPSALLSHIAKGEQAPAGGDGGALQWPTADRVERRDDMSASGKLTLIRQRDGDIVVNVSKGETMADWESATVEFCAGGGGGGRSMRTREALIALMVAIEADNVERPIDRAAAPLAGEGETKQRYFDALCWALGTNGEFPTRAEGQGAYWWRKELMERAGLSWNGEQFVDAATPSTPPTAPEAAIVEKIAQRWDGCMVPMFDAVGNLTTRLDIGATIRADADIEAAPDGEARDAKPAGCVKPDTDKQVFFYEQDFYVLSNFSAFTLRRNDRVFHTSEAAYHYEKFIGPEGSEAWGAALDVYIAESAHEAFKIAERNKHLRRPDWDAVKVDIMRAILRAKVDQHEYVRRKLLATGDRELIEDSWRDDFWGWGPNRDGKNMLGKLWMEVRSELRAAMAGGSK